MIELIILSLSLLILAYIVITFNSLKVMENRIDNAWSQIDVQLKKRSDLIPNLVETVKGYAKHEKTTFENITKARAAISKASSVTEKAKAHNMLSNTLKSLFAVVENYPELKANQNFLMLQEELSGIESKIAYARQFYNDTVLKFNNMVEMLPSNIIAGFMGLKEKSYFEVSEAERKNVKVKF